MFSTGEPILRAYSGEYLVHILTAGPQNHQSALKSRVFGEAKDGSCFSTYLKG